MKQLVVVALLIAAPTAAKAQDPNPQDDRVRFNTEIVVTPERTETPRALVPASTTVLPAATILTLPAVNFGNIVSFLPGFSVAQGEFHAGRPVLSARGFFGGGEADYVLLLVDGVPVTDAESGLIDWPVVTASSIRTVEAMRGPGASMYGDSAVGGVLQVLTNRGQGTYANMSAGSFGTYLADGSSGRRFGRGGFDVSAAARRTRGFSQHSAARELIGGASVDGHVGASTWRWTGSGNNRRREDPGASPLQTVRSDLTLSDSVYRFDDSQRHGFATSFVLQRVGGERTGLVRVYASTRDDAAVRTILLAPGLPDRRQRTITSNGIGGTAQGGSTFGARGRATVQVGLDLARDQLTTAYLPVSNTGQLGSDGPQVEGHRVRAGMFAASSWDAVSRLRVTGALRWDHVGDRGFNAPATFSGNHHAWSPRIGVTLHALDAGNLAVFAQAARAFKAPTLDQLFDPRPFPDFRGGTFTISNVALRPQRATNVEAGVSGNSHFNWSALAYRMNVEDEIDFDIRTFSYGNIGRSRHIGVELEGNGRVSTWLQPSAAYAWTHVEDAESGNQLKNVPRHVFVLASSVTLPWHLGAYARFRHASGAYFDDANSVPIRGPSTLDLRIRRTFGRQTIFVDAVNLANNHYEEYGFTLTDFAGRVVPYAYAGAPRALRVGVSIAVAGLSVANP
jgi:outer membrane cobalamin receptor